MFFSKTGEGGQKRAGDLKEPVSARGRGAAWLKKKENRKVPMGSSGGRALQ